MSKEEISYPVQTVLVSCKGDFDVMGKRKKVDNLITVDWHMPASFEPFMYAIAIGKKRFSLSLIRQTKVFAVNFMAHEFAKQVLFCGKNSGMKTDKYKAIGLIPVECESIDCKMVKEASAVIECEVVNEFDSGSHVIVVGKILKTHNFNSSKRLFHVGDNQFTTTMR